MQSMFIQSAEGAVMENLQVTLLRYANRFLDLLLKASQWAFVYLVKLLKWIQTQIQRIPLTAFQWIMLAWVLFGFVYVIASPVFEIENELEHFVMVDSVKNFGFPDQSVGEDFPWQEQALNPPLYYILGAIITAPINTGDYSQILDVNPHARPNDVFTIGNKNVFLLPAEPYPLQNSVLAVYLLRSINVLITLGTLFAIHQVALLIVPKRPSIALLAVGITAFNPMIAFLVASVGNLALSMLLNSVLVYTAIRAIQAKLNYRNVAIMVVLSVLACATSYSGFVIVVGASAIIIYIAIRDKAWVNLGIYLGATIALVAVVMGWWFSRNLMLYNDLTSLSALSQMVGVRAEPIEFLRALGEFSYFRGTYWGLFGTNNIRTTEFLYFIADLFVFFSVIGVIYMIAQLYAIRDFAHARRELIYLTALLGVLLAGIVSYFVWFVATTDIQGRFLFPYVIAISPLLAAGFIEMVWWFLFLITPPDRSYVQAGDAVPNEALNPNAVWTSRFFAFLMILTPVFTIIPQYTAPRPLAIVDAQGIDVYARFGDIELVAYDLDQTRYTVGELVQVTLYWKVIQPTERDLTVSVALLPPSNNEIGKVDTYPANGLLRTSTWEAGAIYRDTYFIRLNPEAAFNTGLRLQVTWWDDVTQQRIPIANVNGEPLEAFIVDAGALITRSALPLSEQSVFDDQPIDRQFRDDAIDTVLEELRLESFRFNRRMGEMTLQWEALSNMSIDYHMFLQVLDANNQLVGQADAQPLVPTSLWLPGERFNSHHPILFPEYFNAEAPLRAVLPPGNYRVIVGVYDFDTMERLTLNPRQMPAEELIDDATPSPEATLDAGVSPTPLPSPTSLPTSTPEGMTEENLPRPNYYVLFTFDILPDGTFLSKRLDEVQPEVTPEATEQILPGTPGFIPDMGRADELLDQIYDGTSLPVEPVIETTVESTASN
jgi:hypothetical protein